MPETTRDEKSLRQEAERFFEQQHNSSDTALSKECIRFLQKQIAPELPPARKVSTREEIQLSIASELGKIAYWEYDAEEDLFTFNDQFYAIFGTTAQEQGGYRMTPDRYALTFVHPDHRDQVREHIKIALETDDEGYNGRAEHKIIYANGEAGYISVQICLVKNGEGKTVKTYGANQDITEITQSRRHLERINRLLNSIRSINKLINTEKDADTLALKTVNTLIRDRGFAAARIALFDTNSQSPRNIVSPEANISRAQNLPALEDDNWLDALQKLSPAAFERSVTQLQRFETTQGREKYRTLCIPMRYEERFFGLLSVTSKLHETNQSRRQELTQELADDLGYALFRLELEQQKEQATAELRKAKELAEQACLAKDQFLAVISHEIRTPLNPILGYTQLLQQRKQSDTDRTYLDSIRRAGKQQLTLIDHILTYSRLDRGSIQPRITQFPLLQCCEEALQDAQRSCKEIDYRLKNGGEYQSIERDILVEGEESMFLEILNNLLTNACKYTQSGSIELYIGYQKSDEAKANFHFAVQDTGIGIEPKLVDQLFQPFTQADSSFTRQHKGAGLGLAICKKLVDTLGGEIGVESKYGFGSRFWFTLPMKIVSSARSPKVVEEPQAIDLDIINGQSILLVEDNDENSAFTRCLLEGYGAQITNVSNGLEAVRLCSIQTFDLIFMDLAMPVLNGIDATDRIRNTDNPNRRTPIIPLTADASLESAEKCVVAGMNGYLTKPIAFARLVDTVKSVLA